MTAAAALTLLALVACGDDKPSAPSAPDPGVAACQAAIQSYQSGDDDSEVPAAVIAGLKASNNADLKAVGAAFEQLNAISDEEMAEHLDEIIEAMGKFGTGCAAVGVPLPTEMVNPAG